MDALCVHTKLAPQIALNLPDQQASLHN